MSHSSFPIPVSVGTPVIEISLQDVTAQAGINRLEILDHARVLSASSPGFNQTLC